VLYKGYAGKLLRVNLTTGKVWEQPLSGELARNYLGGRGLGIKIIYDEVPAGTDPLSADNKLVFAPGALVGTRVPLACSTAITGKSALTYLIMTQPLFEKAGWPVVLKQAGYDAVIVEGRAERPVYLWIDDGPAKILSAEHLWGKGTYETEKMIKEELHDTEIPVHAIGSAGEKLVRFSIVEFKGELQTRGGLGAVMGSKNLKAIAVRGTHNINVPDADKLEEWALNFTNNKIIGGAAYLAFAVAQIATSSFAFALVDKQPFNNLQTFEGIGTGFPAESLSLELFSRMLARYTCFNCPMGCRGVVQIKSGPGEGIIHEGPACASGTALGTMCGHANWDTIIYADRLCNAYGIDPNSCGAVIAFAMECFERGYITKEDTGGLELKFGNEEAEIEMLHRIGRRETKLGYLLGEGVKKASEKIGNASAEGAMHVKGMEIEHGFLSAPRSVVPLAMATSSMGGSAFDVWFNQEFADAYLIEEEEKRIADYLEPLLKGYQGMPKDKSAFVRAMEIFHSGEESIQMQLAYPTFGMTKTGFCKVSQNAQAIAGSIGFCLAWNHIYDDAEMKHLPHADKALVDAINVATGMGITVDELERVGERIYNLERAFNVREGVRRKDDWLPERLFKVHVYKGRRREKIVDPDELRKELGDYYKVRGWDPKTGIPSPEKLRQLGLEKAADDMKKILKKEAATTKREGKSAKERR